MPEGIVYKEIFCTECMEVTSHVEIDTVEGKKFSCEICNTYNVPQQEKLVMQVEVQSELSWFRKDYTEEEWAEFTTKMQDPTYAKETAMKSLDTALGNISAIDESEVKVLKVEVTKEDK